MTVSPDGSDVRELAQLHVTDLTWSPDGSALLGFPELKVIQSDGSESRTLAPQNDRAGPGSWRPDGRHIAFVGRGRAYIADADGTNLTSCRSTSGIGLWTESLAWSGHRTANTSAS
jgi:Tol biopolymer transport system component